MAKIRVTQQRVIIGAENADNLRVAQQKVTVGVQSGTARLTQQRIVVGVVGGLLKVTSQRLLVVYGVISIQVASNTINCVQQVIFNQFFATPGSTAQLFQTVFLNKDSNLSPSNQLNLTQVATGKVTLLKDLSDTVNCVQVADFRKVLPSLSASNVLVLVSSTAGGFRNASNTCLVTHLAEAEIFFLGGATSNSLNLIQVVSLAGSLFNRSALNQLNCTQQALYNIIASKLIVQDIGCSHFVVGTPLRGKKYILLQAPFDCLQASVVLPAPLFSDTENLISNLNLKRSMNGETYTYIKSSDVRILRYTFRLTRGKSLEVEEFFRSYNSAEIKMQNWKGEIWKVNVITNPIDFVQTGRDAPTEDRTDVSLEFEGVKLSG